jgi:hypothetical protein
MIDAPFANVDQDVARPFRASGTAQPDSSPAMRLGSSSGGLVHSNAELELHRGPPWIEPTSMQASAGTASNRATADFISS